MDVGTDFESSVRKFLLISPTSSLVIFHDGAKGLIFYLYTL
jgi:hypothetical protein